MTLDFESDQFLKLLTDALRAGPGSPQWHEAILRLQASQEGSTGADEYRLLCDARAHLESGKEYRSVRAGPNFTRSVMDAIALQGLPGPKRISTTKLIAGIAAVLLIGTLVMVSYLLMVNGAHSDAQTEAIEALSSKLLGNAVTSLTLDQSPTSDWKLIGKLPLDFSNGMRPEPSAKPHDTASADVTAGGLVWQTPMASDTPFEVETTLKVNRSTDGLIPEIAISDGNDFSDDNATGSHELVWLLQSGQGKVVLPSGRLEAQGGLSKGAHDPLTIRIRVDDQNAIVVMDGKRIWAGASGLATDKPRYVAIRLLSRGNEKPDVESFQSVRVLTGQ